ncbi:MAG: response regulator transcription factor [Actinomycetota bacterium]|nr:response regulator transcription factor [Actinomycetota bacterium]
MRRARILVADDVETLRSGVRELLLRESDFHVFEARGLDELRTAVERHAPDIVLVDLDLPPSGGIAAVAELQRSETSSIVWSFEPDRSTVLEAIRAGARGYLDKEISPQGLVRALRGVVRGEAALSRELVTLLIDALHGVEERDRVRDQAAVLSSREREVLALVSRGARNREIGEELHISEFTVKRHVQNILNKLEVPSRRSAAAVYRSAFQPDWLATDARSPASLAG